MPFPPCPFPRVPRGRHDAFTLLEMLVVMAIALLLTGLLVIGLRGFNGSTTRHSAVSTLMGVFDQARSVAISDGRPTYVVFVSAPRGQTQNTSTVTAAMWGRAYAVFEDPILQDNSTAANFLPQQKSTWLYLPTGIAFKSDTSDGTPPSLTTSLSATNDTTKFNVTATSGVVLLSLPYVKFDSSGQIVDHTSNPPQVLDPGSALLRVLIFEGTASNAGVEVSTRRSAGTTGSNVKYALDEILLKPITGRARYTLDPSSNLASSN